MPFNLVI